MATSVEKTVLGFYTINNEYIMAGDCVWVFPRSIEAYKPLRVARIEKLEDNNGGGVKMEVRWYYTPEETTAGRRSFHGQKELFLSDQYDTVTAASIKGKCFVQSLSHDYYMELKYAAEEYYYSRYSYEAATGDFSPAVVKVYCKCWMPNNPDNMMVKCVHCCDRFHPICLGMTDDQAKQLNQYMCEECSSHHVATQVRDGITAYEITNEDKINKINNEEVQLLESDSGTPRRVENQFREEAQPVESDYLATRGRADNQPSKETQQVESDSATPQRAENQPSAEAQPVESDLPTPRRVENQPSEEALLPVKIDLPTPRKAEKPPKQEAQQVIIDLESDEEVQRAEEQSPKRRKLTPSDWERINKVLEHPWMEEIRDNWGWGKDQKIKLQLPISGPASQYTIGELGVMSLAPGKCVNGEIIDAYRILLRNREQRIKEGEKSEGSRSYFFLPTWFTLAEKYVETYAAEKGNKKLQLEQDTKNRESFLRQYVRQEDGPTIAEADYICFPCNVRQKHWVLFVWSVAEWKVQVLDSRDYGRKTTSLTRKYNYNIMCIIEKMIPEMLSYCNPSGRYPKQIPKCNVVQDRPIQHNDWDCGVMVCMYMAYTVQGYDLADLSCSQEEIDNFRYRIALDIQNGRASDTTQF